MNKRTFPAWAAFAAAIVLIIGCGGGGGGGGTSGGGGAAGGGGGAADLIDLGLAAPPPGIFLEVLGVRAGKFDPFSLRPGSKVQLGVTEYTPGGSIRSYTPRNWAMLGATSAQVTISSSGVMEALAATGKPFTVSADITVGSTTQTIVQDFMVSSSTTTLSGFVRNDNTSAGVKYVQVEAANAAGTIVAAAMTGDGGKFVMRVPTGTTKLSVKRETIPTDTFYRQLKYNNRDYAADVTTCAIKLGTITAAKDNPLPQPIRLYPKDGGPPPPPPNCLAD